MSPFKLMTLKIRLNGIRSFLTVRKTGYAASEQTWVEGALKTTELMLQENFKLEKPEWLSQSYQLD
jgi:hypothetical protein